MLGRAKTAGRKGKIYDMNKRLLNLAVALASLAAPRLANGIDLIKEVAVFKYHKGIKEAKNRQKKIRGTGRSIAKKKAKRSAE